MNLHFGRSSHRLLGALLLTFAFTLAAAQQPGPHNDITDVPGVKVGHYTVNDPDSGTLTGTTVVLVEGGAVAGVDVRGSAPGTRETDLLNPINLVQEVQAIVLSGGSAYGLEAATGTVRYLEEQGIGYPVGPDRVVPIVPSAILFDLGRGGDWTQRPTAEYGYQAALAANEGPIEQGSVGAGTGAFAGGNIKGGLGSASVVLDGGIVVAAIVAVNPAGRPTNPVTNELYGAWLGLGDEFANLVSPATLGYGGASEDYFALFSDPNTTVQNTTIGIIATNATLTKSQALKIAQMAHDGYARALRPVHTMGDGDVIFAMGTGDMELGNAFGAIGSAAADVMSRAIVHAILNATSAGDRLSYCDTFVGACGE